MTARGGVTITFTFDVHGRLTSQQVGGNVTAFTDTPDRMVETATTRGATTTYRYDGDLARTTKTGAGLTVYTVHDGAGGSSAPSSSRMGRCGRTATIYISAGDCWARCGRGLRGAAWAEGVAAASPPAQTRLFTGKERDAETGLDYFGARYYRQDLGRFTTVDPHHVGGNILDPQSWNAYAYARNNPLRYIDPDGLSYILCSRADQKLYVFDKHGVLQGTYNAANNVTTGSYELRDGVYPFEHTDKPLPPNPTGPNDDRFTEDGSMGPYGRFHLKDFRGVDNLMHYHIGLHSGRRFSGGYEAYTKGCIRTTDEAMKDIVDLAKDDPLTELIVMHAPVRMKTFTIRTAFVYFGSLGWIPIVSVTVSE